MAHSGRVPSDKVDETRTITLTRGKKKGGASVRKQPAEIKRRAPAIISRWSYI